MTQLSTRVNARDKSAIKEVYEQYFKPCAAIVMRDGGDLEDAREIFQAAMISLITKLENPAFEIHNVKSYLYQSCFNLWVQYKKKGRLFVSTDKEDSLVQIKDEGLENLEQKKEQEERYRMMYACMKQLSEECQKLLTLSFFKKKKDVEIAPILDYKVGFVKIKRQRCMKSLRKCMST